MAACFGCETPLIFVDGGLIEDWEVVSGINSVTKEMAATITITFNNGREETIDSSRVEIK